MRNLAKIGAFLLCLLTCTSCFTTMAALAVGSAKKVSDAVTERNIELQVTTLEQIEEHVTFGRTPDGTVVVIVTQLCPYRDGRVVRAHFERVGDCTYTNLSRERKVAPVYVRRNSKRMRALAEDFMSRSAGVPPQVSFGGNWI